MSQRMERFTQRARRVLSLAQEAAVNFNHNYIGVEHLLLGLIREEGGIAVRVLRDMGLEAKRVEEEVLKQTHATTRLPNRALDLSPGTKRVLELAVDEARRMGHHYIGTEHLLLGLVRQSEGVAIDVLKSLRVTPEEIRRNTRRMIQESLVQVSSPPDFSPLPANQLPRRATTFTQTQVYEVIQATITRILDMVAAQELTTAQAAYLIGALKPYFSTSIDEKGRLLAQAVTSAELEKRRMHVIIRSVATHAILMEFTVPLKSALDSIQMKSALDNIEMLVNAANYSSRFGAQDMGDNHIEFHIEDKQ